MPFRGTIWDKHCTSGERGPAIVLHRHCEAEGRGNLQHYASKPIAPINIVYPQFSMLTYLSAYPTAAVEIATPLLRLAMTEVGGGWTFYSRWRSTRLVGGVVLRAANL